jgi:Transposase IS66 family
MSPRPPPDLDALPVSELKRLVESLFAEVARLKETVAAQRDEIARLKALKGPPRLPPGPGASGMEQASERERRAADLRTRAQPPGRRKDAKTAKLRIDEERVIRAAGVPQGARFKGYQSFVVQDLTVQPRVIRLRRERWLCPDGRTVIARLPPEIDGHFGPALRRFVLMQHHQGQVTMPRLVTLLRSIGIEISKRQVVRLLTAGPRRECFLEEARSVLRAGLETARWITVDDTGARHRAGNGVCTQIGDARFTYFATTALKSRLNFLELLRAGYGDYEVNAAALEYMRRRALPAHAIARLAEHPRKRFANARTWQCHLRRLGITRLKHSLDPVRVASEGAVWGSIVAHGLLPGTVIVSDDAGQFDVGPRHALCWVHAERLIHRLDAFTAAQYTAQQRVRRRIWWFYADLKAYCRDPTAARRTALRRRFDRIFRQRTGFATLDKLLARLQAKKADLLQVLDRPEIPLHTNGSENDIRCQVTKRKVSGGTRSDAGRDCRDAFLGLMKTCAKLGISFWSYLGDRLGIPDSYPVGYLPDRVRAAAKPA